MNRNLQTFFIPNATSARNIGDAAMLESLVKLIKKTNSSAMIRIQSSEPSTYSAGIGHSLKPTLYYWAVFESKSWITRLYRLYLLFSAYMGLRYSLPFLVSQKLRILLEDYAKADTIIFVGGGYIRSKKGLTQSLNVIMHLFPFVLARCFPARRIVAPISIGPFAYRWQAHLAAYCLQDCDCLAVRERYSYEMIKPYQPAQLVLSYDHALLIRRISKQNAQTKKIKIGFTIRPWLDSKAQTKLEEAYVSALVWLSKEKRIVIQPIIQVDAPQFGEGDREVTNRVVYRLIQEGLTVLAPINIKSVSHARRVYAKLSLLLGMRMHSNILAATQGVPFVAISYEYKTQGIAYDLGLEDYCIPCTDVDAVRLFSLLHRAVQNRNRLKRLINKQLLKIQAKEETQWLKLLSHSEYKKSKFLDRAYYKMQLTAQFIFGI